MRLNQKNTIFDDDIVILGTEINGYLWATDEFVNRVNYNKYGDDDYINIYVNYDVFKEKIRVEAQGEENGKWFCKPIDITDDEEIYILNSFIEYYFGEIENFNDYVAEVKKDLKN